MTRAAIYLIILALIVILWRRRRREKPYIKYGDVRIWKASAEENERWRRYYDRD